MRIDPLHLVDVTRLRAASFWSVTLLILALTAARAGVRRAIAPGRHTT